MQNTPTQIYRVNRLKMLILVLFSSFFVAIGIPSLEKNGIPYWGGIIFFSLGIIVGLLLLIPKATHLKLTSEGFETKSFFKTKFTKWSEIKSLRRKKMTGHTIISFDYTPTPKKSKTGVVHSIYNIKSKQLLKEMKTYKTKNNPLRKPQILQ